MAASIFGKSSRYGSDFIFELLIELSDYAVEGRYAFLQEEIGDIEKAYQHVSQRIKGPIYLDYFFFIGANNPATPTFQDFFQISKGVLSFHHRGQHLPLAQGLFVMKNPKNPPMNRLLIISLAGIFSINLPSVK